MSRGHYGASARNQRDAGVGYDSSWGADNSHRSEALRVVADLSKKEWSRKPVAFGYMLGARGTIVQAFTEGPANDPFWYAKDWYQYAVPKAGYVAWFDARDLTKPRAEHFGHVAMIAAWVGQAKDQPPPAPEKSVTWGKWVVYGIAGAAVVGVGLMVRSAHKSMTLTDKKFRSAGLKGLFGT